MPVEMHPIVYHEPPGGFAPLDPPSWVGGHAPPPKKKKKRNPCDAQLEDIRVVFKKSMGVGVVIRGAGGLVASGYATWEPIEGGHVDSPNPLLPSSPDVYPGFVYIYDGNAVGDSSDTEQFDKTTQ